MNEKFLKGVDLFHQSLFFDAHEIWEAAWNDAEGNEKRFLQALIQIAVAFLKWQSGIPGGALKMHKMATEKLAALPDLCLGLDVRAVEADFKSAMAPLVSGKSEIPFPQKVFRLRKA